jgi:phenylpyruvate tautomerase PptA (4-oxalocrotonate tautomerase family)
MPFLRFDLIEGRTDQELATLLDATHRVVLRTFHVPKGDRYQIVHEHKPSRVRIEDTGLGIPRSDKVVVLQITTRPRTTEEKTAFYRDLCSELQVACIVAPTDVIVSFVENTDEDWSFGHGRAQFITGELEGSKPSTKQ